MLVKMLATQKDLEPYVDLQYLAQVTKFSNLVMVPKIDITSKSEIDFLQMGCRKDNDQPDRLVKTFSL